MSDKYVRILGHLEMERLPLGILRTLAERADDGGRCEFSLDELGRESGYAITSVYRALRLLKHQGYVWEERRANTASERRRYRLWLPVGEPWDPWEPWGEGGAA